MSMEVEIEGLKEAMARLDAGLVAGPVRAFMSRAAMYVEGKAKEKAPVDTGRLRSSITHEVDGETVPQWAKVGTNLSYAPYMEYGTGLLTDGEGGGGRHWPPGDALNQWAARHGFGENAGGFVASIIGKRGGLKPLRYLRGAMEESESAIQSLLKTCSDAIGRLWSG